MFRIGLNDCRAGFGAFQQLGGLRLLGYGFRAFWQTSSSKVASIHAQLGWIPGYAHNGFLDLALYLGFLGLGTFVLGYLVLYSRAFKLLWQEADLSAMWMCTFLSFMLLYNLTEGSILRQNDIYWVLYVSTAVSLSRRLPLSRSRSLGTELPGGAK